MKMVYARINELKNEMDLLIGVHGKELNDPEIIDISQELDELIVMTMILNQGR